jgi:hypothetical protein
MTQIIERQESSHHCNSRFTVNFFRPNIHIYTNIKKHKGGQIQTIAAVKLRSKASAASRHYR